MGFALGINTNFAINRIVEPEELVRVVGEEMGLRRIQLTPELLSPDWPAAVIADHVRRYNSACERYDVRITTTFTGTYTRVNHVGHPDAGVRAHWCAWMLRWIDIAADLGAAGTGSQLAVLTFREDRDPQLRAARLASVTEAWQAFCEHAKARGLAFLMWEPMSIRREFGETIAACRELHDRLAPTMPLPFKLNLDIDHGDVTSPNPDDVDPYAWARAFAKDSPVVHIKQSSMNKGGHWPFTAKWNAEGRILPDKLLAALREGGGTDNELVFEFSFREREPTDSEVVPALRESAAFWRAAIPD